MPQGAIAADLWIHFATQPQNLNGYFLMLLYSIKKNPQISKNVFSGKPKA